MPSICFHLIFLSLLFGCIIIFFLFLLFFYVRIDKICCTYITCCGCAICFVMFSPVFFTILVFTYSVSFFGFFIIFRIAFLSIFFSWFRLIFFLPPPSGKIKLAMERCSADLIKCSCQCRWQQMFSCTN